MMTINHFEIDDIFGRICVIFYLVCLFGFTSNIFYAFESTYTSAIAFYVTQRLFAACWYVGSGMILPQVRGSMLITAIMNTIGCILWIVSIHVSWPNKLAPIFIAIMFDLFGNVVIITIARKMAAGKLTWTKCTKWFDFFPALNIEHRVERNNAFVSLVFGYSILTILFQSRSSFGIDAFFGKGVLGLIQAFLFNWIYFEVDAFHVHVHAIRRHWISATVWASLPVSYQSATVRTGRRS
jgi:low temperature requirement protein LtrA